MEAELLNIFDENKKQVGVATREEVHRIGHWHEVFHCWFVSREEGRDFIYLQLRSERKKDYPNLLDITAAGHLLADETVQDGVREIQEEVGIEVAFEEVVPLGILDYCIVNEKMIDKEFAHIFLYEYDGTFNDFRLQKEEVAGMMRATFDDFCELWLGTKEEIRVTGFTINAYEEKTWVDTYVGKNSFVTHDGSYYQHVIRLIGEQLRK
ncbi:NUDIX hydrolase [Brevibacillus migulae]|uniref:NUDIX hydrolase n=1 Tax=Brevibacillus migulae TaxID=1644114 RepID=UPI00106E012C|nr:NUDIX domain-containing protein [Brevibacillus migulae]